LAVVLLAANLVDKLLASRKAEALAWLAAAASERYSVMWAEAIRMGQHNYPWREPKDLAAVLADVRPVLASLGIVEGTEGCSEPEIAAAEQRSPRPFPDDVRAFYRAMRPTELFAPGTRKEFGFYTLESKELTWKSTEGAEPAEDWDGAQGLFLGQSAFGDPFWWVEGHRTAPNGSIFLLDHEGNLSEEVMFVHFARSFREFLAKLAYFRALDSMPRHELFRREYLELNPSVKS
jgi:hypothetical protein